MVRISSGIVMATVLGCAGAGVDSAGSAAQSRPDSNEEAREVLAADGAEGREQRPAETAAAANDGESPLKTGQIVLFGANSEPVTITVEVAIREPDRERGLMYRRHLDPDRGMLFVFEEAEHQSFWMENTTIPLDVLFLDDDLVIVGVVTNTVPLSRDSIEVEGLSRYVLEVNAGFTRAHGIMPGGRVELIGISLLEEAP